MAGSKLLVMVGSGPGIGVSVASTFASHGFDIALLSRNAKRLERDARTVAESAGVKDARVKTFAVDVSDHVALKQRLDEVKQSMGSPEVVFFNAARVAESKIGSTEPDFILDDFKICNIGLYAAATWALPLLGESTKNAGSHPSFLISGGGIHDHPDPEHFSLSMQKAAQYNLAGSLSQVAGPKGIHVATIVIGGVVSDDNPIINANNIAKDAWRLYQQEKCSWEFSSMIRNIEEQ